MDKITVLDIETENIGYDIMGHNKRIISIQMYDGQNGSIFYDGSSKNTLNEAKSIIESQIAEDYKFVGFNIRNFDVFFIKKFLGIEISDNHIIEISEMPPMTKIREKLGKNRPRLVDICNHLGIECIHKNMMDEKSLKFKNQSNVVILAKEGAEKWVKERGWGYDFSYNLALDKISGGMAILESFNEFITNEGDTSSLFYRYAMGDVFSEHELFEVLKKG